MNGKTGIDFREKFLAKVIQPLDQLYRDFMGLIQK